MTIQTLDSNIINGFENLEEDMIDIFHPKRMYLNCAVTIPDAVKKIKEYRKVMPEGHIYKKFWLFKSNQLLAIIEYDEGE